MITLNKDGYGFESLINSFSHETEFFNIKYEYLDTPIDPQIELQGTSSFLCRCLIKVENKLNKESISAVLNLLYVPIETSMGVAIDHTFYSVCPLSSRASGWYHLKKKKNNQLKNILELVPDSGRSIVFEENNGFVTVNLGSKVKKIPLGIYLKSISGLSYREIIKKIGYRSPLIFKSFDNEKPYIECVNYLLGKLIENTSLTLDSIPKESRPKELKRLLGPRYIRLSDSARGRYERTTSFLNRAIGLELLNPVLDLEEGTKLTASMLERLDKEVESIMVLKDGKPYELRKLPMGDNFLEIDELCTELNIFFNNLEGFNYYGDMFDDLNREIVSVEESARRNISSKLIEIDSMLVSNLISPDISVKNLTLGALDNNLNAFMDKCKLEFDNSQSAETTNGISFLSKRAKVVTNYKGNTSADIISIKASQMSAFDLYHIPESKKVGLVWHTVVNANINSSGEVESPFYRVVNGSVDASEVVKLTSKDRVNKIIAPWDSDLSQDRVKAYLGADVIDVPTDMIDYIEYNVFNTLSIASAMIPFSEFSAGKRIVMGCSQNKQAVPCINSEAPLVSTGAINFNNEASELVIRAVNILDMIYRQEFILGFDESVYNEFLKLPIKLESLNDSKSDYMEYKFSTNYNGKNYYTILVLPFTKKGSEDTMYHYYLNHSPNRSYIGNQIVLYNNSIDIEKYDLVKHVDLGKGSNSEDVLFDFDTCLGYNYLTAFKSSGVPNMDDGVCFSDSILGTFCAVHPRMIELKEEIKNFKEGVTETFGLLCPSKTHDMNGLPKLGVTLLPKDNLIGRIVKKDGISNQKYSTLGLDKEGEVAYAYIEGNTAVVGLVTLADLEVGDKVAGDHGNKGVVGRIIPKKDMPFTADGKSIEVTLNPLGIPSRMNLSQLMVCLMGYAMKLQNKRMIISPQNPNSYEIVSEYLEDPRLKQQQLFDGRTGLPFDRKTTIGYMYLKKQTHTVMSKFNSCAEPESFNVVTNQPNKGKDIGGAQTIGEYETWNLESLGLSSVTQELFTIKSDDVKGRESLRECLENDKLYEGEMNSTNIHSKQAELRMFGCDVYLEDGKQVIKIMTNDCIRGLSYSPLKLTKESLQDDAIFGSTLSTKGVDYAKSNWGYLSLGKEIINPAFIYKGNVPKLIIAKVVRTEVKDGVNNIVSKLEPLSKDRITKVIAGKSYISVTNGIVYYATNANDVESPETGISAVVKAFKASKIEHTRKYYNSLKEKILNKDNFKPEHLFNLSILLNTLDTIEDVSSDGTFSCLVIDSYPVLPKNFRFKMDNRSADLDEYYFRVMTAIKSGDANKIYESILTLLGLDNNYKLSEETKAKNFSEFFLGKNSQDRHGLVRENMLSHKVSYSFRSVIAPGKIPLGKLGVPRQICYNLKKLELRKRLIDRFPIFEMVDGLVDQFITSMQIGSSSRTSYLFKTLVKDEEEVDKLDYYMEECDNIMRDLLSESAVLFGRQPTLKELSIRALEPVMVEGYAILLNVLLCAGYNADFDGDQMWGAMLHTQKSIREAKEKASPVMYMLESKDGSVALSPTQDILLGLYLSTMLHDNVLDASSHGKYNLNNVNYFNSLNEIKRNVEFGQLNRKDLVCYTHKNGNKYISTAGRILFNSLFKGGFTNEEYKNNLNLSYINPSNYKELKYDGLIKNNSTSIAYQSEVDGVVETRYYNTIGIDNVLKNEFPNMQPEELNDLLDNILDFGEEGCVVSGISLHLDSFKDNKLAEELSDIYNNLVKEWQDLYELGLMPESEKSSLFIKAANYISSRVKKSVLNDYERNDDVFIIIDSGARGNAGQLMATSGLIGIVSKSSTSQIDTPVLKNYKKGLTASDYYIMSHGTLYGVSTVQQDVGKSGEMTREFVYMGSGMKVVETDCGSGLLDIDVIYDEPITNESELAGKSINHNSSLYEETKFITKNGLINKDTISYIFKNKITEIPLLDGSTVFVKYKISELFRNMFMNKLASDLPYLSEGSIITKETLDYIEDNQIKTIKSRTVITCKSKGGICAKCYGLLHNTRKLPSIGYPAGVKAGQSIGETSTQLLLDTINKNGASDGTVSAISVCKSIIAGSVIDKYKYSILSKADTTVSVEDSGKFSIVTIDKEKYKVLKSDLKVVDGEYVNLGQSISSGLVNVRDIPETLPNFLYLRKLQQVKSLFYLFFDSNISLDARHFEVLIKAQLDYVKVYLSDCPEIKEGCIYDYSLVENKINEGFNIKFINEPLSKADRILNVSGTDTVLCHHDPINIMVKMATNESIQNNKMSFIGALYSGSNLETGKISTPQSPRYMGLSIEENKEESVAVTSEFEEVFKPVQTDNVDDLLSSIDLSSFDRLKKKKKPEVETPNISGISDSNFFGGSNESTVDLDSDYEEVELDLDLDWDSTDTVNDSQSSVQFDSNNDNNSNEAFTSSNLSEMKNSSIFGSFGVTSNPSNNKLKVDEFESEIEDFDFNSEEINLDFEESSNFDDEQLSNDDLYASTDLDSELGLGDDAEDIDID